MSFFSSANDNICFSPGENCRHSWASTVLRPLIILNYMVLLWYVRFCVPRIIDQKSQAHATYDLVHTKPLLLYIRWYTITEIDQLTLLHPAIWLRRNSYMLISILNFQLSILFLTCVWWRVRGLKRFKLVEFWHLYCFFLHLYCFLVNRNIVLWCHMIDRDSSALFPEAR